MGYLTAFDPDHQGRKNIVELFTLNRMKFTHTYAYDKREKLGTDLKPGKPSL
jgi:hypothetical protein